jgi:hypothetical protein
VINVTTPSGKQETITLRPDATHGQTASLVLMELCLREGVKASDFSLFLVSTPSTYGTSTLGSLVERELEPGENLKVEDDAGLVLKRRPSSTQVAERTHGR